jgi:hypothetical protein
MTEALAIRAAGTFESLPATVPRTVLGAMMAVGFAGCALVGPDPSELSGRQVAVAPGLVFSLPGPVDLGRSVEATQLITARYQQQKFVFETRISITPARLLLAGTDMLGRRAMTIEWNGGALKVEAANWVPPELRARNVIADIMLLHWPAGAVRGGLPAGATLREPVPEHRVIAVAGRDVIRADRTAGTPGSWNGRWIYHNDAWGYDLDIQSHETAP